MGAKGETYHDIRSHTAFSTCSSALYLPVLTARTASCSFSQTSGSYRLSAFSSSAICRGIEDNEERTDKGMRWRWKSCSHSLHSMNILRRVMKQCLTRFSAFSGETHERSSLAASMSRNSPSISRILHFYQRRCFVCQRKLT